MGVYHSILECIRFPKYPRKSFAMLNVLMLKSKVINSALIFIVSIIIILVSAIGLNIIDSKLEVGDDKQVNIIDDKIMKCYACDKLGFKVDYPDIESPMEDGMNRVISLKKDIEEENLAKQAEYKAEHERRVKEAERLAEIEAEKVRLAEIAEKERLAKLEAEREIRRKERAEKQEVATVSRGQGYIGQAQAYTATAYTAYCNGCSGITRTGHNLRNSIYQNGKRVIAVDPNRIPLGSVVQVTLSNGTSFEAIASDTGGAIKGNIIDVSHSTKEEAYRFGRQNVEVRMIKRGN